MKDNRFYLARTKYNQHGFQGSSDVSINTKVSRSMIDALESDTSTRGVSHLSVKKLAEYYGVSVDYLLGLSQIPNSDTNVRAVCEYTGLSEATVEKLHTIHDKTGFLRVFFEEMVDTPSYDISPIEGTIYELIKSAIARKKDNEEFERVAEHWKDIKYKNEDFDSSYAPTTTEYNPETGKYTISPGEIAELYLSKAKEFLTKTIGILVEDVRDKIVEQIKDNPERDIDFYLPPWSESEDVVYKMREDD